MFPRRDATYDELMNDKGANDKDELIRETQRTTEPTLGREVERQGQSSADSDERSDEHIREQVAQHAQHTERRIERHTTHCTNRVKTSGGERGHQTPRRWCSAVPVIELDLDWPTDDGQSWPTPEIPGRPLRALPLHFHFSISPDKAALHSRRGIIDLDAGTTERTAPSLPRHLGPLCPLPPWSVLLLFIIIILSYINCIWCLPVWQWRSLGTRRVAKAKLHLVTRPPIWTAPDRLFCRRIIDNIFCNYF